MFIKFLTSFPLMSGEPADGAGGGAPVEVTPAAAPEPAKTFDDVASDMFKTVQSEMARTEEPSPPPAPAPAPAAAAPQAPTFDPLAQHAQLLQQMQHTQAQMLERLQPTPAAPQAPQERGPPTVEEIMEDYRPPRRQDNESDAAYAVRNQAAVLNHMNHANATYMKEQARSIARESVETYQRQIHQQQQLAQAKSAISFELDSAVRDAGYAPDSPQGRFLRQTLETDVWTGVATGRFRGQTEQAFRAGLRSWVAEARKVLAPPPPAAGQRPNLQMVNAPISQGGGTSAPAAPQSAKAPEARSFDEAMAAAYGQFTRNGS